MPYFKQRSIFTLALTSMKNQIELDRHGVANRNDMTIKMTEIKVYRGIAKLSEVDLFYMDSQKGDPVIICLHGRCGRAETWCDFIRYYGKHYRVIAPDQRGHGLSSKPISTYTDKEMAEDIIELMEVLNIKSTILIGHSMGGAVAGYLAAHYPEYVQAIAILDKSAAGPEMPLSIEEYQKHNPTSGWPLPFLSRLDAEKYICKRSRSALEYQYFMNSLVETVDGYEMLFSSEAMSVGIGQYVSWYHLLPQIRCPVLLVRSNSHEAVPDYDYARMQALIADCVSCEMACKDHNVHLSDPKQFYDYMDQFLSYALRQKVGSK